MRSLIMEDFVNFKIAQKLKEKGFREECLLHYTDTGSIFSNSIDTYDRPNQELDYSDFQKCFNNGNSIGLVDAPTISQVLKWLRGKGVDIYCTPNWHNKTDKYYVVCIVKDRIYNYGAYMDDNDFSTYEKAALAGIEYVLDNLI